MAHRPLRILFSGMMAGVPYQGGASWAVLQYLLGLRDLGHEVCFVEPVAPEAVIPANSALRTSHNASYFGRVVDDFGLVRSAALLLTGTRETVGLPYERLCQFASRADALINISGMLVDPELISQIHVRAYLDLDPAFIQLWHTQGVDMRFDAHTHFVTIGQAVGEPDCLVPTCGRIWIPTAQPVALDHWPVVEAYSRNALTTVANWRGYGSIEHEGIHYGQKAHSLRPLMELPRLTQERFMLALTIDPAEDKDLALLALNGWELVDPSVASSPMGYRTFLQSSKAEFGIAKSGYVVSRCGWFSDRSACYLASGKPVIAQDTGFESWLPTGEGLFSFKDAGSVLSAIEEIHRDYGRHQRAARRIAESYFDARQVLPRLLAALGL